MPPETLVLLYATGVLAGIVSVLVSLASIVSYPVLLAVGLPPVTANVTNTVALVLTGVGAALGSQRELAGLRPIVLRLAVAAVVGGFTGAALLLVLPERVFELVVPVLIAGASILLLAQPRLRSRPMLQPRGLRPGPVAAFTATSVYLGYFGAAGGILSLAVLSTMLDRPYHDVNAAKNTLAAFANGAAAVVFVMAGSRGVGIRDPAGPGPVHGRAGGTGDRPPGACTGTAARRGRVWADSRRRARLGDVPVAEGRAPVGQAPGSQARATTSSPAATRPGVSTSAYIPNGTPRGLAMSGR